MTNRAGAPEILLGVAISLSSACGEAAPPERRPAPVAHEASPEGRSPYSHDYDFTEDWFTSYIPIWSRVLQPFSGKPELRYLEVGVYEGRSFLWVLDNVATHPSSRLTGIDIELPAKLLANVEASGQADRIELIEGSSQTELRRLPLRSFDVIYIDGSHTADDVLSDAVLAWGTLKDRGLLIFDDYNWDGVPLTGGARLPRALLPRLAIDAFLEAFRYELEVILKQYQVIVRKRENACGGLKGHCSPLGSYLWDWQRGLLLSGAGSRPVRTSPEEREVIERVLRMGEADEPTRADPVYRSLVRRLNLEPTPP